MTWPLGVSLILAVSALCMFILRLMFRAELAEFRGALMLELNHRYMNSEIAEQKLSAIKVSIDHTRHTLRNEMMLYFHRAIKELPETPQ